MQIDKQKIIGMLKDRDVGHNALPLLVLDGGIRGLWRACRAYRSASPSRARRKPARI